jgi:hypothetical protein
MELHMSGKYKKCTECRMLGQLICKNNVRSAPVADREGSKVDRPLPRATPERAKELGKGLAKELARSVWQGERSPSSLDVMKLAHARQEADEGCPGPFAPRQLFSV